MAHALLDSPATYLYSFQLPVRTSIISNGRTYGVDATHFLVETPHGTNLPIYYNSIDEADHFSVGDKATLPNGLSYIKTGDMWLLAPVRAPKPVSVATAVYEHEGVTYRVIEQTPETTDPNIQRPLVIPFNVLICEVEDNGKFPGSDGEAFAQPSDGKRKKVTIAINFPLVKPFDGELRSEKAQGNAMTKKGPLAKFIIQEIKKTLDLEKNNVLAFADSKFVKEVTLDDLFLINLVQTSHATFQPTIALRM